MSTSGIELFTAGTPNGQKISVFLEELGIPYKTTAIDIMKNVQKEPWFLKLNPNGRIPTIVDHDRNDFPVFESGAIFLYLAQHYDKAHQFSFEDPDEHSEMVQWLFFQNAGVGPMQGQANVFYRYAPEKIPFAIKRYQDETKRLYSVLEDRLKQDGGRQYLAGKNGGKYSVADISTFTWVRCAPWAGIDLSEFPNVVEWVKRIEARPAVRKGLGEDMIEKVRKDPKLAEPYKGYILPGPQ